MAKKLIIVWLSLLIVLFSSISIYADENVQGDFFVKNIVINGQEIVNYNLQYPFLIYNDTTYIPLTPEIGEVCGFYTSMDLESRTLKLLKTDSTKQNITSNWQKNNNEDLMLRVIRDAKILVYDAEVSENGEEDTLLIPEFLVTEIELEGMPLLAAGKYIYIPLRTMENDTFNWDIYYNSNYGICISTKAGKSGYSLCDQKECLLNNGLAQYIVDMNPKVSKSKAQEYVFLFKRASEVYDVDIKILMAMAHKESTFNTRAVSSGGSLGMMQILPSTGAGYGLAKADLYDPKKNIDFGAMYLKEKLSAYGGDLVKGLSAYNQGSARVNKGTYSTAYANRVLGAYNGINNYLSTKGYIL